MDTVLHETRSAVTLLTLNRPEKLNALNYAMIDRLMARLDAAEADPSVSAVILTGAGRAFSAGGDIPEFSASIERSTEEAVREFSRRKGERRSLKAGLQRRQVQLGGGLGIPGIVEIRGGFDAGDVAVDQRKDLAQIEAEMQGCVG